MENMSPTKHVGQESVEMRDVGNEAARQKEDVQYVEGAGDLKTKVIQGSEALFEAMISEPPSKTHKRMLQLYGICAVAYLVATMNGFDGSLMGSLLVMKPYQQEFGANIVGVRAGLINSFNTIGTAGALPFTGPLLDNFGRLKSIFVGCFIIILGTIIEGTSNISGVLGQFLAGRFFLGFGVQFCNAAAPIVLEISHPAYRGVLTAMYEIGFYVGSIGAAGATRGSVIYTTNQSWLIPTWVQMICPGIICSIVLFLPESPRWLFAHGKPEQARSILTKYHGLDDPNSVYVTLQMREFAEGIELNGADKRWWDYRVLYNTKERAYRMYCYFLFAMGISWNGSSLVTYYLPAFLSTAGITNPVTVLDINLGISFASAIATIIGASLVERVGRRLLFFWNLVALSVIWIIITICVAEYDQTSVTGAATAAVVFIFIFNISTATVITPLSGVYVVEVFSYEQRAKGFAVGTFITVAMALVNSYALPVAIAAIGWKTYIIFCIYCPIIAVVVWFTMVETKGRTLEELTEVFSARNPRKASTSKRKVEIDTNTQRVIDTKEL